MRKRNYIFLFAFLLVLLCFVVFYLRRNSTDSRGKALNNTNLTNVSVSPTYTSTVSFEIPSVFTGITECSNNSQTSECINRLIEERKSADQRLIIKLKPGTYTFEFPIIIYAQNNIVIESLDYTQKAVVYFTTNKTSFQNTLMYYPINILDSTDIKISNISFSGLKDPSNPTPKAIGVCSTTSALTENIMIQNNIVNSFGYSFILLGRSFPDVPSNYLKRESELNTTTFSLFRAGEKRLVLFLKDNPNSQYCKGKINNVYFQNNQVNNTLEGFYFDPAAVELTRDDNVRFPDEPYPTPFGHSNVNAIDWSLLDAKVSSNNTNVFITDNNFSNTGNKITHINILIIHNNIFDTGNNPDAYHGTAAINLGMGNRNVKITNNTLKFPKGNNISDRGIRIDLKFSEHWQFGIGKFPAYYPDGTIKPYPCTNLENCAPAALGVPSQNIDIENNNFIENYIRLDDISINFDPQYINSCTCKTLSCLPNKIDSNGRILACYDDKSQNTSLEERDRVLLYGEAYSKEVDKNQTFGNPKADNIYIYSNNVTLNGALVTDQATLVKKDSTDSSLLLKNAVRTPNKRFVGRDNIVINFSPMPTLTPQSYKNKGDLNSDNKVNILDLSILAINWGSQTTAADINGDSKVDVLDLSILSTNWLKTF